MRDKFKTKEYFEKAYEFYQDNYEIDYKRYKELLHDGEKLDIKRNYCIGMILFFKERFYSGYSLGVSINILSKDILELRNFLLEYWKKNDGSYSNIEFVFYMAIIFKFSLEKVSPLLNLLEKENYKDFILDTMANYFNPDFQIRTEKLKFNKSLKPLKEIIKFAKKDKKAAVERLKHYLNEEWLNMQDGRIYKNQHLREDGSLSYLGYWCIEAAALVIMLDLDDTELKDCDYYPYDLVHG
jgi:hypothetical protein